MPLSPLSEFLNGGVVTARHPSLLLPGELQRADNCCYRRKSPAIHRAPGRTAYNSSPLSSGIKGLVQLTYDQDIDQLLAWVQGDGTTSYMQRDNFTSLTSTAFGLLTGPGTVNVTTNGTTTLTATTAGSFANMIAGARCFGSNIPIGAYVVSSTANTVVLNVAATSSITLDVSFDMGIPFGLPDTGNETLDVIQWQSTYFALTKTGPTTRIFWKTGLGAGAPRSLVMRQAGLLPVISFPAGSVSVQTGPAWSSVLGNGWYWFLVTEILNSGNDSEPDAESAYLANDGQAAVVQITNYANQFVRITFPTVRNNGLYGTPQATNWGIYMSVIAPNAAAYPDPTSMPSLATFRRIMTVDISETQKDIKFTNATQTKAPTGFEAAAPSGYVQFVTPGLALTYNGQYSIGFSGAGAPSGTSWKTFNFTTGAPWSGYGVTGITARLVARVNSAFGNAAGYYITLDNTTTKFSAGKYQIANNTNFHIIEVGGQFDTWGVAWTPSDIATIRMSVLRAGSNHLQELDVDYMELTVWFNGASVDNTSLDLEGPSYQVVTFRSQIGTTVSDPANFIIPSASTGDIFQGSLVLNDTTVPNIMRYSLPGQPESFPKPYFMQFNSKKKDIITFIRKLGQILIVGMRDSIKRINYLPTENDVDFGQGIAYEDLATDHGIVGPLAATTFDITGGGIFLAYVAYNGIYYTDGITTRPINQDLDFTNLVKQSALSTSILRVYPKEKWIVFAYCPNGASHTKNTQVMIFSYDGSHTKEGGYFPAIGPLTISSRSLAEVNQNGLTYIFSGHETNGTIYVEDNGDVQAAGYQVHNLSNVLVAAPISPLIVTRRIYPGGYTRDVRNEKIYVSHYTFGTSYAIASTLTLNSPIVASAGLFGNVIQGMRVQGAGIHPDTVVVTVTSTSSITLSSNAQISGASTLTFDDGVISLTLRGNGLDENLVTLDNQYISTLAGDLSMTHHDNMRQAIELLIQKSVLPDGTIVDLGQRMRINNFTYLIEDEGSELGRVP